MVSLCYYCITSKGKHICAKSIRQICQKLTNWSETEGEIYDFYTDRYVCRVKWENNEWFVTEKVRLIVGEIKLIDGQYCEVEPVEERIPGTYDMHKSGPPVPKLTVR